MTFTHLLNTLLHDTTGTSLPLFKPELALCATVVLMLFLRVFRVLEKIDSFWIALAGSAAGFYFAIPWDHLGELGSLGRTELFSGLLVFDSFTIYFRAILLLFAILFVIFTKLSGIPDREDAPDFYSLVLGATVGMCLMSSANHLLTIFLGVEMASVPSYALAGMLKGRPASSEAALKYSVFGAGAAGVMLYGISLLAGVLGTCHLPTMAERLADLGSSGQLADRAIVLAMGGLMIGVGLAFKLSAFPFHFWCPDVFEGATAEVNAFLSVASKAAALALLVRVVVGFGNLPQPAVSQPLPGGVAIVGQDQNSHPSPAIKTGEFKFVSVTVPSIKSQAADASNDKLAPVRRYIVLLVALIAAVTCTFGNLAAYGQTNIKRLMAYSTIAHAGYIMMPVAAGVALLGSNPGAAQYAFVAVPFYVGLYLFMNLGAFAAIAFIRNKTRSEQIESYAGMIRVSPGVVVCLSLILFSLVGLPPLAGFSAKYVAFASLVRAMEAPAFRSVMLALLVIGGINTALSLFYYLRVVKTMAIDPEPTDRPASGFSLVSLPGAFLVIVTVPILLLGVFWDQFYTWLQSRRESSAMIGFDSNAALNRLLVILYRSFPMYLADAVPWTHPGDERAESVLNHIVVDYRMYSGRIAELLLDRRALGGFGEYPMSFTDTHDLSLDYLIGELIFYQRQDIAAIRQCAEDIRTDLTARALAEEVLGNARGHLQSLEELLPRPAAA